MRFEVTVTRKSIYVVDARNEDEAVDDVLCSNYQPDDVVNAVAVVKCEDPRDRRECACGCGKRRGTSCLDEML